MNLKRLNRLAHKHIHHIVSKIENEEFDEIVAEALDLKTILEKDIPFVIFFRFWSDVNIISGDWIDEDFLACKERLNEIFRQIPNKRIEEFIRDFSGINWIISLFKTMQDYKDEFIDQETYQIKMMLRFDLFRAYACCLAVAENRSIEVDGEEDYNICVNKLKQLRESDTYGFIRPYITAVLITMREDQTLLTDRLSYLSSVI